MVVFVDLEGEDEEMQKTHNGASHHHSFICSQLQKLRLQDGPTEPPETTSNAQSSVERPNMNINGFSAALSCYPIALSLSAHLDLNDLHSLSRTCRQFRANLLQFSAQLTAHSLRCTYDAQPLIADLAALFNIANDDTSTPELAPLVPSLSNDRLRAILASLPSSASFTIHNPYDPATNAISNLITMTKIGACARDLVAECRKCGTVVCRNCAAKAPSDRCLKDRFRRLCGACLEAPLQAHTAPVKSLDRDPSAFDTPPRSSASSSRSSRSTSGSSPPTSSTSISTDPEAHTTAFTTAAFIRNPCSCATQGVFLCAPCGQNLRAADTTYKRVWTWRSRYSTHIGGLGTGMGEGDQGQKCGRGEGCLDPTGEGVAWVEIDCSDVRQERQDRQPRHELSNIYSRAALREEGRHDISQDENPERPGYLRQEIEGIGGVVKKKVKKKVRVGATVWEYDEERESGKYLEREASGRERSWCGWCGRVVMGQKDRQSLDA